MARPLHPALASVLESQNARYEKSESREAHLRSLRNGAAVVCTGQQVGLFLGPLYTIYKAASTIRLARALSERWSAPVVPVFWLQTEDHDAAEIAVCHVASSGAEPLTLSLEVSGEHVSISHRVLPETVEVELARLADALSRLPHVEEHMLCLRRHYRPGASWGQAFAGVLATLFAEEGLVLIDPRDPALAPLAAPVHRRALADAKPIAEALVARSRALEAAGLHPGVHVREDAPLSFFHPDGPGGPRYRLAADGDGFHEIGRTRSHSREELLRALDADPAAFSTSALLRPILEDTWLPTVAYVGGPGEVAYFAQLAPLYDAFSLTMPVVVPRNRFRLIDETTRRTLTRRGLTPAAACRPFDEVVARAGAAGGISGDRIAADLVASVDRALVEVAPLLGEVGERGRRALAKTRGSMARSAERLGRSFDRARGQQHREVADDVRRVQSRLLPRGVPQERFFGLPSFAARYGQRAFIERVLAAATPLGVGVEDLDL